MVKKNRIEKTYKKNNTKKLKNHIFSITFRSAYGCYRRNSYCLPYY